MNRPKCKDCPWFCPLIDDENCGYCTNGTHGKLLKDMDTSTAFGTYFCEDHPMFTKWYKYCVKRMKGNP